MSKPKISIAIPVYEMENKEFYLNRCLESIKNQTYKDYEIVITENGRGMASNTNEAIKKCKGRFIKILFMDDYLAHKYSLKEIVDRFQSRWLVTGCEHDNHSPDHYPRYNEDIHKGYNTIGSPSVLTILNKNPLLFDENMSWLLDCDYYKRMYDKYGEPTILNTVNVGIGIHKGQATYILSDELKTNEHDYMLKKYEGTIR